MVVNSPRSMDASALNLYLQPRILLVLALGFSSGLPLALTFGTLAVWLSEASVNKGTIGLFALTGLPYTIKFLWAPLVDRLPVPGFTSRWGRRRGWIIFSQLWLSCALFALGSSHPEQNPLLTAALALIVTFWSATQDIGIDALRVEILAERQQGAGAAMVVLGYRIGMLVSGAGALYLATAWGWFVTYSIMAGLQLGGTLFTLLAPEPAAESPLTPAASRPGFFRTAVIAPLQEFSGRSNWMVILWFILLYKLGDALAGVMSNPFYLELGFTKVTIATVTKLFGLAATIAGGVVGGLLVHRRGIHASLLLCGVAQMFSNLLFALLALVGSNTWMLAATIAVENLSGGMGTAALVAYLSSLCNVRYTATQYALLSSLTALGRTLFAASAGWLAEAWAWPLFFAFTTVAALPGLLLLKWTIPTPPPAPTGDCC